VLAKIDLALARVAVAVSVLPAPAPRMPVFVAGTRAYLHAVRAMREHRSQLVWFRWLYVLFSRYMWVNEWVEIPARAVEES
jgi:N-acetylglucosaminylphosphatidylinositol deacetylase